MKKSIFINASLVALAILASCQKELLIENTTTATGVTEFTATIEQTKTAIAADGKVTWTAGDEITVTDAASASAVYVAEAAGASATFTLKEGETAVGDGPYTATYGDIANQVYDASGANCPLTAAQTSTTNFKFSSPYAVVKMTAKSEGGEVIKSVDVNYGTNKSTLGCGDGVTLTADGIDFYVAVEPATDAALSVTFYTATKLATETRKSSVTLAAKDILPVGLTFNASDWTAIPTPTLPDGALSGVFTVADPDGTPDSGDETKVHFSQGNLYWDGDSFEFETKQYDFPSSWNTSHIGHFYWSKTETVAYAKSYNGGLTASSDVFFTNTDTGTAKPNLTINGIPGKYRMLSIAEWRYLFSNNNSGLGESSYENDTRRGKYKYGVTVCGKANCVVLLPDIWDETVISLTNFASTTAYSDSSNPTWQAMEEAGAVCLPATGHRYDSGIYNVGSVGNYWSSSAYDSDNAFYVVLRDYSINPNSLENRKYGHGARLVTDAVAPAPAPAEPEYVEMKMGTGDSAYTLKWAKYNLGATTVAGSEETCYGDYYAWGETEPYYASRTFDSTNQKWIFNTWKEGKTNGYSWLSYCGNSSFSEWSTPPYDATSKILKAEYDAATANWGTSWRMPTSQEFKDLYDACGGSYNITEYASPKTCGENTTFDKGVYMCDSYDGVKGFLFCDGTNKLFFPAAGGCVSSHIQSCNLGGYWSGSLSPSKESGEKAYYMNCTSNNDIQPQEDFNRFQGFSVRPVKAEAAPTATKGTAKRTGDIDVNWVQLWENGPKFAEYNVGAENNNAEDYGGYYAWGGTYKNGGGITWSADHNTTNTGTGNLTSTDDTATKLWGSNWRMPTKDEFDALLANCTVANIVDPNDNTKLLGRKYTGKGSYTSNSVFLPAAGFCSFGLVYSQGDSGDYWSSTPNGSYYACYLVFKSGDQNVNNDNRSSGYSVRAVLAE